MLGCLNGALDDESATQSTFKSPPLQKPYNHGSHYPGIVKDEGLKKADSFNTLSVNCWQNIQSVNASWLFRQND